MKSGFPESHSKLPSPEKLEIHYPECQLWLMDIAIIEEEEFALFLNQLHASSVCKFHSFLRKDRQRQFLAGRIILRRAISSFLVIEENEINILERGTVKPVISVQNHISSTIGFSISHSQKWVACAINKRPAPIGLDIEYQQNRRNFLEIARFAFLPDEYQWIKDQTIDKQQKAFYQLWTRKEAFYKMQSDMKDFSFQGNPQPAFKTCDWHIQLMADRKLSIAICSLNQTVSL